VFIRLPVAASAVILSLAVSACSPSTSLRDGLVTSSVRPGSYSARERECLARAMFFESRRSSREWLIAVGSVVMNRVESAEYPDTVCEVVAQKNQFAPGVMTRKMNSKALPDVMAAADAVLKGERHPKIQNAKFFHQAGLSFPYDNMNYVLEAGGNAFYEKRSRADRRAKPVRTQAQLIAAGRTENKAARQSAESGTAEQQIGALSFDVEPAQADAIGALIASGRKFAVVE